LTSYNGFSVSNQHSLTVTQVVLLHRVKSPVKCASTSFVWYCTAAVSVLVMLPMQYDGLFTLEMLYLWPNYAFFPAVFQLLTL